MEQEIGKSKSGGPSRLRASKPPHSQSGLAEDDCLIPGS